MSELNVRLKLSMIRGILGKHGMVPFLKGNLTKQGNKRDGEGTGGGDSQSGSVKEKEKHELEKRGDR